MNQHELDERVFLHVAKHLLRQGAKSQMSGLDATCAYRGTGRRSCAVGCLITDECYAAVIEGRIANSGRVLDCIKQSLPDVLGLSVINGMPSTSLLLDLQSMHDATQVSEWRNELHKIAHTRNFSTSEI